MGGDFDLKIFKNDFFFLRGAIHIINWRIAKFPLEKILRLQKMSVPSFLN